MNKKVVNRENEQNFSKFLSLILRHKPEVVGLNLQENGWVNTEELINAINTSNSNEYIASLELLKHIVETDSKQRYSFKSDGVNDFAYIRANQGHSIKELKMDFKEVIPPKYLYHGTSEKNARLIISSGKIKPMSRQMVHLSKDIETAIKVGSRHGIPIVFRIDTELAIEDNIKFYMSENNVYLTNELDVKYTECLP